MDTRFLTPIIGATAMLLSAGPAAAAAVDAAMVSNTCAGCHGTDGKSEGPAPVIAGLSEEYLRSAMQEYRDGSRYSTIMGRIARGYSDAEIDAMARFFAAQSWTPGEQDIDEDLAEQGLALHTGNMCAGCHGAQGMASSPDVPNLAGQYADYLYFQMRDYANPHMAVPDTAMVMRPLCQGMKDEELKALAHFYASQR